MIRSNSNVMLTWQTCGHRFNRFAGSKRRALAFYFSVRIRYMFLRSICTGTSDLGVCMISVLAKRMLQRSADFQFKNVLGRRICRKSTLRCCILFASTEVMHTLRSDFAQSLHFDLENIYQIQRQNKM